MEKRSTGVQSSLDIFCRVDVGFIRLDNGRLQYFVNEVERGPNVGLWAGRKWAHMMGKVASGLGELLHLWVSNNV